MECGQIFPVDGLGELEGLVSELEFGVLRAPLEQLVEVGLLIFHSVDGARADLCVLEVAACVPVAHNGVLQMAVVFNVRLEAGVVPFGLDIASDRLGRLGGAAVREGVLVHCLGKDLFGLSEVCGA